MRALTYVVQLVAVGVGYYLLDLGSVKVVAAHPNAVALWPPTGLAFAAVMLGGYRMLPAIFVAGFLTHAVPFGPSYGAAAIAAGNTLEAFVLSSLVDGWAEGRTTFATTRGIARFVPIAMVAAAVGASVAAGTEVLLPLSPRTEPADIAAFGAIWVPWWLRDVTAALVITPPLVLWVTERPRGFDFSSLLEGSAIVAATAALGALLLGPLALELPNRGALAFITVLPVIWAALRRGPRDTATAALVLAGAATWGMTAGGPFAETMETPEPLLILLMIGAAVPSLLLAADAVAGARADRMLRSTRNELRQAREQLAQSHKLEAVGQLTGGVAHDFNNLLTVIVGNLDMALRQLETSTDALAERLRRAINNARRGAVRATAITQRLLAFSRKQRVEPRPINVNNLLTNLTDFLRRSVGETVGLEIVVADDLWTVETDPVQLETAVLNLAVNARDAMPTGGKVTITTGNSFLDEAYCREHEELVPGQYVQVAVADTGTGMSKEVLERVFEPFFTTKEAGQGTGLGLAQVYGFVKQSGGHVEIDSEPGKGTTVRMFLPRLSGKTAVEQTPERPAFMLDTAPTILLVEDDHDVRAYVVEILRDMHFQVLEAHDADSALGLLERNDVHLDLLLSDVVLPGLNGRQLADEIKRRQPDVRVLFMSGYGPAAIMQHGQIEPGTDVIQKPVTQEMLAERIREVLEDA